MLVHISGWSQEPEDSFPYLRAIMDGVRDSGSEIARDWVGVSEYQKKTKKMPDSQIDWHDAEEQNSTSLGRSGMYIAEVSSYRLYHGYELASALNQGKPVLLLSRKPFRQFAISGVENSLLHLREYTSVEELKNIVANFIEQNSVPRHKEYLEVPLSHKLFSYLNDFSERSHKTEGELLRDLAEDGLKYRKLIEERK